MLMRLLLLGALLAQAREAQAEPRYGAAVDVGFPDGAVISGAFPIRDDISAHAGLGHNTGAFGLRAGLRWRLMRASVSPFLAAEGGHYFTAATPAWLQERVEKDGLRNQILESFGYSYVNTHVGAEIGHGALRFSLQIGISFLRAHAATIKTNRSFMPPIDLYRETTFSAWLIGGRAGLAYWFE